jgi:uncharacterized coiled-coil DUF342 family protein
MAANNKSSGKQGAGGAVTRELKQLRNKVKELTLKLGSEVKARKLDARVAAEARKAREQLNKQVKALSEQGRKMAGELKSTLSDAAKRQQALKEARDKVTELKAELGRRAAELKRKSEELRKIAVESARGAAAVIRGERERPAAAPAPAEPPPTAPSEHSEESTGQGDQPKAT